MGQTHKLNFMKNHYLLVCMKVSQNANLILSNSVKMFAWLAQNVNFLLIPNL